MYDISSKYGIFKIPNLSEWLLAPVCNVADPDPIGSGPFWPDPDPDVWDRIRIRGY
jgi:hypothetical protein